MGIFGKHEKVSQRMDARAAAEVLASQAHTITPDSVFQSISSDPNTQESLRILFYTTHVSIIVHWLEEERHRVFPDARPKSVLEAFRGITSQPHNGYPAVNDNLAEAFDLKLTELMEIINGPKEEGAQAMLVWCKEWLESVIADELEPKRISLLTSTALIQTINKAVLHFGKVVQVSLYGDSYREA